MRKPNKYYIFISLSVVSILSLFLLTILSPTENKSNPIVKPGTSTPTTTSNSPPLTNYTASANTSTSTEDSAPPIAVASTAIDTSTPTFTSESGQVFPLRTYKPLANDPNANQWWTTSTGLDVAWNIGAGPKQTTVAIIDTGFALNHEEFTNRWAINSGEGGPIAIEATSKLNCTSRNLSLNKSCNLIDDDFDGIVDNETGQTTKQNLSQLNCTDQGLQLDKSCNLIDDDNNGFIDDARGWDFINYDRSPQAGEVNPEGTGTSHGTEAIGVLGATGNNNKGIAGVNWSTKLLPLQAIDDNAYGNTITVGRAIYYAVDRGVDVISLSLGSSIEDDFVRKAVDYAIDHGTIVVAATGNDGCNCISYPAIYPEVVAVGSYGQIGNPSSFSSYGSSIDVLAPGENIRTTNWTKVNGISSYVNGVSGTSFAAPYVSGLLALARSHQSTATWGELINSMLSTANHSGLTFTSPFTNQLGSGYVRAGSLISRVTTPANSYLRYDFTPTPITGTLSSNRIYQCFDPDFPTAPFYRISKGTSIFYTIDSLEAIRATLRGDGVSNLGRTCTGLPNDPSSPRTINLLREIENIVGKSQ